MAMMRDIPYPPLVLANRVGSLEGADDPYRFYDELGLATRRGLEAALPDGWDWAGKRVLDFGCGAGRTLRQWLPEAELAAFSGCDIDAESVAWLSENLSPPFEVFVNGAEPPIDKPDAAFDLIYAVSVFTHLTDSWSRWLVELHRLLDDGGVLLVTFMGPGISEWISGQPWDEERTGMFTFRAGQSWDLGGPMVMHSPWWIVEHWGRAFDVLGVSPEGFARVGDGPSQGIAALRKRDVFLSPADLERIDPANPREAPALARNLDFVQREVVELRENLERERSQRRSAEERAARAEQAYERIVHSRSWRLTGALRWTMERLRGG